MNLCHLPSFSNVSIYANMQSWPDSAYFCYIFRLITVHIFKKNYCIKLTCLIISQCIKEKMAGVTGTCFTFLETVLSSDSTYLIHLYIMFYICIFVIQTDVIVRDHSFPRAAEFRAEPRNLAVAAEFHGIRGNSAERPNSGPFLFMSVISHSSLISHQ